MFVIVHFDATDNVGYFVIVHNFCSCAFQREENRKSHCKGKHLGVVLRRHDLASGSVSV